MTKKSTKPKARSKPPERPEKPYHGFPLYAHPSGMWAKKIRGNVVYFGSWKSDPDGVEALKKFNREWPYLKDGREPPAVDTGDGCTVTLLCNAFLEAKEDKTDSGELSRRTFRDYYATCKRLIEHFGKDRRVDDLRPDDFRKLRNKLSGKLSLGPTSLKNEINRVRIVFNFAHDERLIDRPVHYGQAFNRPSAKALRKARNEAGPRLFERDELKRILDALDGKPVLKDEKTGEPKSLKVDPVLKAMVLLGVNAGFGNTDVASLPQSAVDLDNRWIDFPRPKTEIPRRIPLWSETVDALREAIAKRPKPNDRNDSDFVFLTAHGNRWVRIQEKTVNPNDEETEKVGDEQSDKKPTDFVALDALSQRFARLLKKLKINGRKGLGFYTLRHNFETIGGESKDQVAVNAVMGHVDNSMAGVYRERISDERLRAVVETVRGWLFPTSPDENRAGGE